MRNLTRAVELDPRNVFLFQQVAYSYQLLRRYPESGAALDRALEIAGKDVDTRVQRAEVAFYGRADLRPLHTTIDAILAEDPAAAPSLADSWVNLALCERDLPGISRALGALTGDSFRLVNFVRVNRPFVEGLQARMRGDTAAARSAFTVARMQQEELIHVQPDYAPALCVLGLIDAGLGRREEALREGRRAVELMPVAQDTITGSDMLALFAVICAWVGDKDVAFQQLAIATRIPGTLSYGQLKLHPFWDPLRGDPRFEEIVASLAPQDTKQ
ncbi:MAG: tetratricopeptide repeat protein [Chthoniobacterales bacterium]|nr:tetratricopeptide repeat protein [Chthoniobacterales bacterium]